MSAPHELPAEIGPYRVVGRLGAGASGQVFRVVDPTGRELALKLLTDPGAGERFAREGQVAASLQHSGIVGVHGQGVTPQGRAYLVFELVEGEDLEAAFRHLAPLELVRVLREVAGALAHAHTRGVVHRDVKPHNVLVDRQGRARVADFGLAHAAGYERLTRSGVMVGTPHYMAPEQVTGERQRFGPATDVWALGVILYRVLTGRLPFDGANMIELAARITSVTPAPPRPHSPDLPASLGEVCQRALHKDPAGRYPDAQAFAADLDRALAGEAVEGLGRGSARRAAALALGVAALGLGGVVLAFTLRGGRHQEPARVTSAPEPSRHERRLAGLRHEFSQALERAAAGDAGAEAELVRQARSAAHEPELAPALWQAGAARLASLAPDADPGVRALLLGLAPLAGFADPEDPSARKAADVALENVCLLLGRGQSETDDVGRRSALLQTGCQRLRELAEAGLRPIDRVKGIETLDALMGMLVFGIMEFEPYWQGQLAGVRLDFPSFGDYFVPKQSMRTRPDWERPWGADTRDPWERYFELRVAVQAERDPPSYRALRVAYEDPERFGGAGWRLGPRQRAGLALVLSEAPGLELDRVLELLAEALRLDPESIEAFRRRAFVLRDAGEVDQAAQTFEEGIALYLRVYPTNLYRRWVYNALLSGLVRLRVDQGDRAAARATWRELLESAPDVAEALQSDYPWLAAQ